MSNQGNAHYSSGIINNFWKKSLPKPNFEPWLMPKLKFKSDNLKIYLGKGLKRTFSELDSSAVRQKMKGLNYESVEINEHIRRGALHSIFFDNTNNKAEKQISGIILDSRNHFTRKKSNNRRYITIFSGLNRSKSKNFNQSESCETAICGGGYNFSGFRILKKNTFYFAVLLAFAMCFFVSCSNSSSSGSTSVSNFGKLGKECYPNKTCDGSLLCDEESNICVEDPENPLNDYDTPSDPENDGNNPIEDNDSDKPIEDNDSDNKPIDNDKDDIIGTNDDDSVSITDEDNPVENNDSDEIPNQSPEHYYGGCKFTPEDMVATKEEIEAGIYDEINERIRKIGEKNKEICLGRYNMVKKYDSEGNVYIVDECEVNNVYLGLEEPIWYENVIPTVFNAMGLEPNTPHRILNISKGKWCMNKGDPLDIYIKIKNMKIKAYVSVFECLEQAGGDMLSFEITPSVDGECIGTTSTSDQVIMPKQHTSRTPGTQKDKELCTTMPNYQYDEANNICHTTITEEVYMGMVAHTLLNVKGFSWAETPYRITYMKKDINTNVIYMDMLVNDMVVHITLQNPKDPCLEHGGTYADVPPPGFDNNYNDLCTIGLLNPKHNIKDKTVPGLKKPFYNVPQKRYAQSVRLKRQKWLAQKAVCSSVSFS
ncbi:hypothetical protein II898_08405 [bacterium]|nr:hypothetical protein [bacterium]